MPGNALGAVRMSVMETQGQADLFIGSRVSPCQLAPLCPASPPFSSSRLLRLYGADTAAALPELCGDRQDPPAGSPRELS